MPYQAILCDIEGTISPISFVRDTLFPYAAQNLDAFIRSEAEHLQNLRTCIDDLWTVYPEMKGDIEKTIATLLNWISEDRKETHLKSIQGMIWRTGYESGELKAPLYPDAFEQLKHWHQRNIPIYIYSSGSIQAQHLFFQYSDQGDVRYLFNGFFDTTSGNKKEAQSYQNILNDIGAFQSVDHPSNILFLSDIDAELLAAQNVGLSTAWLRRELTTLDDTSPNEPNIPMHLSFETILV